MIISFYSYKGGVGRSQLCANVASYLCHRLDKKILLWDWDFEAPGLHYFFNKKNADIRSSGTIEVLQSYATLMRTNAKVTEHDYPTFQTAILPLVETSKGKIDLIPAGNYTEDYIFKVNNFDWYEFYNLLDGQAYIEYIKNWLKQQEYDYVFIDSRTGINDYSGICNIQLPDANVVVMAANDQNIDGCKRIVDGILNSEYTQLFYPKKFIFPVLSRINLNHPHFDIWASKFTDTFSDLLLTLDQTIESDFCKEIFKEFYLDKTLLSDESQYSAGENLLIMDKAKPIPRNSFTAKFANLAEYIRYLSENGSVGIVNQIDNETWLEWARVAEANQENAKAAIAYDKAGELDKSIELGGTYNAYLKVGNECFLKGNKEKALDAYHKSLEFSPAHHTALFNIGLIYAEMGDEDKAIEYYQKAVDINPKYYVALNNIGSLYYNRGEQDKAIEYFEKAIEVNPDYSLALSNLGLAYTDKNEADKGLAYYQQALKVVPTDYVSLNGIGNIYYYKNDKDKAIEYYEKAIEIKPDYHLAFNNIGLAYADKKEYHKAIEYYLKAIALKADYYEAFNNVGTAYADKGDKDIAIEYYEKAIAIKPNYTLAFNNIGLAYADKKEYDKAIEYYQKAIDTDATYYKAFTNMGVAYSNQNNQDKAIECYQNALAINPDYYLAHNNMGLAYYTKKEYDNAIACHLEAIDNNPHYDEAFVNIGIAYNAKSDYDKAIEYYQKAIDINSHNDLAFSNAGLAYSTMGNYDKALEYYQKAIAINPADYQTLTDIGNIYDNKHHKIEAIEYYKKALAIKPDYVEALGNLGFVYIKYGEMNQAESILSKAIDLGNLDTSNMNLGHVYLVKDERDKALAHYIKSIKAFDDKTKFWEGMKDDYQYLKQYGIKQEEYDALLQQIAQHLT